MRPASDGAPYGVSPWLVASGGSLVLTGHEDRRLYLLSPDGSARPLTPEYPGARHLELVNGPDGREIWCVRESRRADREPVRQIVTVPVGGADRFLYPARIERDDTAVASANPVGKPAHPHRHTTRPSAATAGGPARRS